MQIDQAKVLHVVIEETSIKQVLHKKHCNRHLKGKVYRRKFQFGISVQHPNRGILKTCEDAGTEFRRKVGTGAMDF